MKQKFELTLTSKYAAEWGIQDALREFMQNCYDQSKKQEGNDWGVHYDKDTQSLFITNKKSVLKKQSLLLGYTTKQDDDETIGQFGEGYKIALLVLTRLEKTVTIYTGEANKKEEWSSRFVTSKRYNYEKILTVFVDTDTKQNYDNNLTIKIDNITEDEYNDFTSRVLHLQKDVGEFLTCSEGEILLGEKHKGKIYVNGLYVSKIKDFLFGYDIKPAYLKIGRDRNLVDSFDIQFQTSRMWKQHNNEKLAIMISAQSPDIKYIWLPGEENVEELKTVSDDVYEEIKKENEDKDIYPVTNQEEYNMAKEAYPSATPVIVNELQKKVINNSEKFKEKVASYKKEETSPIKEYELWKNKYMGERVYQTAFRELDDIIERIMK